MTPRLSVVMSVYNGAHRLAATVDSILGQTFDDFEFIVIDDGSTDATAAILGRYEDPRIKVLSQENQGLTRALIRGCNEARGEIIARQDCGDRSAPERLAKQLAVLESEPDVVLVSCSTSYHAPGGETLYIAEGDGDQVRHSLLHDDVKNIRGLTHHGSAMFRRAAYDQSGGYRAEFGVAQDLDLWVRMAALGRIVFVLEILYEATMEVSAISAQSRPMQREAARIALQLRDGSDPATLLARAATLRASKGAGLRRNEAAALYFIASCLRRRRDPQWAAYARRAVRRNPLLLKAWLLFVRPGP